MSALLAPSPSVDRSIQHLRTLVDKLQEAAIDGDAPAMADIVNDLHEAGWALYNALAGDRVGSVSRPIACALQDAPRAILPAAILRDVLEDALRREKLRKAAKAG